MKANADSHLAGSYVDRLAEGRFEVGCEGEMIDAFPTIEEAERFAQWSAGMCDCPHEIFDGRTHEMIERVEPLFTP